MKALILGGVAPHIELIQKLKERAYETILVDYYDNPPAKEYADKYYQTSTLDRDAVYKIAESENVDLIISICVDHANVIMCDVAEKLDKPLPYPLKTALMTTDKGIMKQKMKEYSIPTSDFVLVKNGDEIPENISFPAVIKPVDNNGSKGVIRVNSYNQLRGVFDSSMACSRKGEVIVEGFNEGFEIQVDCFANYGKANVLMIRQKLALPRQDSIAMQAYGSIVPANISDSLKIEIKDIAQKMCNAYGFEHTLFFFQAIVNGETIKVIELSPRIGGGLSYKMLKAQTDFDVVNTIIDSYFGNVDNVDIKSKNQYLTTNIVYAKDGVFDHVSGIDEMKKDGVILSFDLMTEKGKNYGDTMDSRNRVGAYLIVDEDYKELLNKTKKAYENIDVISDEGKSIKYKCGYYMG